MGRRAGLLFGARSRREDLSSLSSSSHSFFLIHRPTTDCARRSRHHHHHYRRKDNVFFLPPFLFPVLFFAPLDARVSPPLFMLHMPILSIIPSFFPFFHSSAPQPIIVNSLFFHETRSSFPLLFFRPCLITPSVIYGAALFVWCRYLSSSFFCPSSSRRFSPKPNKSPN